MTACKLASKLGVTPQAVFNAIKAGALAAKQIQTGKRHQWDVKLEDGIKWNEQRKKNYLTVGTRKVIKYQFDLSPEVYQKIINIAAKTNKSRMAVMLKAINEYVERNA